MAISKTDARIRAETYLKEGMNATRTVKKLNPNISEAYARNKGTRMLASATFQKSLAEVLEEKMPKDKRGMLLARNASQSKNYGASNGALELAAKIAGDLAPDKRFNINVDIKTEADADKVLAALKGQLEALEGSSEGGAGQKTIP